MTWDVSFFHGEVNVTGFLEQIRECSGDTLRTIAFLKGGSRSSDNYSNYFLRGPGDVTCNPSQDHSDQQDEDPLYILNLSALSWPSSLSEPAKCQRATLDFDLEPEESKNLGKCSVNSDGGCINQGVRSRTRRAREHQSLSPHVSITGNRLHFRLHDPPWATKSRFKQVLLEKGRAYRDKRPSKVTQW